MGELNILLFNSQDLPKDMPLDGELFGGRGMFQSTIHIVKAGTDDEWEKIKYHVSTVFKLSQLFT